MSKKHKLWFVVSYTMVTPCKAWIIQFLCLSVLDHVCLILMNSSINYCVILFLSKTNKSISWRKKPKTITSVIILTLLICTVFLVQTMVLRGSTIHKTKTSWKNLKKTLNPIPCHISPSRHHKIISMKIEHHQFWMFINIITGSKYFPKSAETNLQ